MTESVPELLEPYRERVERALRAHLSKAAGEAPPALAGAMSYSLFAGGKRIRPVLTLLAHEAGGGEAPGIDAVAASVEMIHTYSLIHDDLPCMDDDDLRRGKPTCHVAHGEAVALLAGDALLTSGFTLLAHAEGIAEEALLRIVRELGAAAGAAGMIGGQVLDLAAEEREAHTLEEIEEIHGRKTGALLSASGVIGALAAGSPEKDVEAVRRYGEKLGLAFQVVDDLIDATGRSEAAGKRVGKDAERGKATYPQVLGVESSRKAARSLAEEAVEALPFDTEGRLLARLAQFVVDRIE